MAWYFIKSTYFIFTRRHNYTLFGLVYIACSIENHKRIIWCTIFISCRWVLIITSKRSKRKRTITFNTQSVENHNFAKWTAIRSIRKPSANFSLRDKMCVVTKSGRKFVCRVKGSHHDVLADADSSAADTLS